jgi:hypothetical protein
MTVAIRLLKMVRSDLPFGPIAVAKAGIYEAEMNQHGALSVRDCNGDLLGVKPGEFEFVGEIPEQWRDDEGEPCEECGGEGWVEGDCFEDTCCCVNPAASHGLVECQSCGGTGNS